MLAATSPHRYDFSAAIAVHRGQQRLCCSHRWRQPIAAVDMTSLQQSLSAIAGGNFAAVDIISLRPSLSITDSHYFAADITRSNHSLQPPLAAADMTSRQQSLSATAGNNFAAVTMIFMRHSLSIAASHYFAAAIATASQISLRTLAMGLAICGYHRHTNPAGLSGSFRTASHPS